MENYVKGYKVFNSDWTCDPTGENPFQYKLGETFETNEEIKIFHKGFHFCKNLIDCLACKRVSPNNKIAEVIALGDVIKGNIFYCTNKIKIERELSWEEVLELTNLGVGNTGLGNTGCYNSGNWNTGKNNEGSLNTGDYNTGRGNTGDKNKGYYNTGFKNSGSFNTGKYNEGNYNTGFKNSGEKNTGNCNLGDSNTGDYNSCNHSTGCFNTNCDEKIRMFNKESDWTYQDWYDSEARFLLNTMDGDRQEWWNGLSAEHKKAILSLPNFDSNIFKRITGIDVTL